MSRRDLVWSQHAIDQALLLFEATDGFDSMKMAAALHAAAEVMGLNGNKRRIYRKHKPLPEQIPNSEHMIAYRQIVREELERFDLTWDYLLYGGQMRPVVDCRWNVMWRCREAGLSLASIGRLLRCDHTTVMHACERMKETDGKYFDNRPVAAATMRQNRARLRKLDERLESLQTDDNLEDLVA